MTQAGRRRLAMPAALLSLLALALPHGDGSAESVAVASLTVTARQSWQLGSLRLESCEIGKRGASGAPTLSAYCAQFAVPENWQAPQGRRIELKVAVLKAEAAVADTDVVTFLDGGPGGAATDDYPLIAAALEPLRSRHHILLIDQRGTGGSNALRCTPDAARDAPLGDGSAAITAPQSAPAIDTTLRSCLLQLGTHAAPQFYTTSAAVQDLEAVRAALRSPWLDLIGISYGTRVAQQYAARYPRSTRSLVLDSPVPNTLALLSEHARNLEAALRALFARCRADTSCAQRFGDPYATLYRLRDALRAKPQPVQLRDPNTFQALQRSLTAADLAAVVRFYAYSPLTAALLPLMLQQALSGNYAPLLGQTQWLADDLGDQISGGVELSVLCAEDVDLLAARPEDEATLLGNGIIAAAREACELWPRGSRPADFHAPLRGGLPVLILSGQYDPVTPPRYGVQIARELRDARQLIAAGQGHGVIGAGCMPRLVQRFIDTLQPRALDAQCLARLGDTPAFIDYNGPAP
jgi:pimeloyl-ACP methyl ester carboxylesterase